MTHYSDRVSSVRVDFFKPSGKWYTTEAVELDASRWNDANIKGMFMDSLEAHLQGRLRGMIAVCLEPYSQYAHPFMATITKQAPNPELLDCIRERAEQRRKKYIERERREMRG